MKAIILAAGLGSRLRPITNDRPKAMVTMLDEPTLFRTIKQLMDVGIKEVTIVVGYKQEMVIKEINKYFGEGKIKFIKNEIFSESGTALSFYLAAKETDSDNDVLMLEGDVLFETQLLKRIVESKISNNIAAIARFCPPLNGTVVEMEGNKIKNYYTKVNSGERENGWKTINIYKFDNDFIYFLCSMFKEKKEQYRESYLEELLQVTVNSGFEIYGVDCGDLLWFEVDDINDLNYARRLFDI